MYKQMAAQTMSRYFPYFSGHGMCCIEAAARERKYLQNWQT